MNGDVLVLIAILFGLCVGAAVGAGAWISTADHQQAIFYIVQSSDGAPPFTGE